MTTEQMDEVDAQDGVWLVITDPGGYDERLLAVYRQTEELKAYKLAAKLGYGEVRWLPYGEVR